VPEHERADRCDLGSDDCVIDQKHFFVRGCLEVPVQGQTEPFIWGVWVSLSEASHLEWLKYFTEAKRAHVAPFFGWLNTWLKPYPNTMNLKTRVHLRDDGIRPYIELEPVARLPGEARVAFALACAERLQSHATFSNDLSAVALVRRILDLTFDAISSPSIRSNIFLRALQLSKDSRLVLRKQERPLLGGALI
jgi:hypothetical protein